MATKPTQPPPTAITITVSFDPANGYTYLSNGANGKEKHARKGDTVTWKITPGTGIRGMELFFPSQNSPFGSGITTCVPDTTYTTTGGAGKYKYITIITDPNGDLVAPDDPEIILDGGLIPVSDEVQVAVAQTGATLVFNIRVG